MAKTTPDEQTKKVGQAEPRMSKDGDIELGQSLLNHGHNTSSMVEIAVSADENRYRQQEDTSKTKGDFSRVASSILIYTFCSVAMVLTNKSLASSYKEKTNGDMNILLVVFQAIVAVVCVEICKRVGIVDYPSFDIATAKQWAPVNIFFCLMLFTGMASLQHNSVPMVTVFKNISNIITSIGDLVFFGTTIEMLVVIAFAVMLGGACAAAVNDVECTVVGILWMVANCLSTSGYVLYMKHATQTVKLSKFGMVFYNNVLCTAFLFPAALFFGEVSTFLSSTQVHTFEYFVKNSFAGLVGFFLNFASLNCVSQTGPTTYAIVGSVNKIPTTFIGFLIFDETITTQTWTFITVAMMGGFLYSYAKIMSSRKK